MFIYTEVCQGAAPFTAGLQTAEEQGDSNDTDSDIKSGRGQNIYGRRTDYRACEQDAQRYVACGRKRRQRDEGTAAV